MTIGVAILPSADGSTYGNAVDEVVGKARQAAEAGLKTVWTGQLFHFDSVALVGHVGREVPEIQVGTSAVPIFGRHPILLAAQAQTAQAATHGRFTLGVGLGARAFVEPVFGVPFERPAKHLAEFLAALRSLFTEGSVDLQGETLTARSPLPTALPGATPPPLLVAAMGPQALRVTGELADGTLPFLAGPKALGEHIVPALTKAAEHAGRPRPRVVAAIPAVVTDDVEAAREKAAEQTAFYDQIPSYQRILGLEGASRAAELVEIGNEEAVAAGIRRYFDAGATEVILTQTGLAGPEAELRTWKLGGELARSGLRA
ncbi:LLM class F420-dependent oxidoreductase [Amycolatopsis anabasis]|uniref:LLM class F420-dependent oxidoreductase n=1 Tax=Amycolatopsis anabasis TaxID=1840409 RepID=UPI00131B4700|nr:LLM class F420-dependent oxidoreductase [Amycolatopsis anabasis]